MDTSGAQVLASKYHSPLKAVLFQREGWCPRLDRENTRWMWNTVLYYTRKLLLLRKLLQSCLTLCDPIDSSPPGSPAPGILQARTLEWVDISFSNAWKWKVKVKSLSCVWPSATPWTEAYQAPPSMGFSSQEYWSGVPLQEKLKSKKMSMCQKDTEASLKGVSTAKSRTSWTIKWTMTIMD